MLILEIKGFSRSGPVGPVETKTLDYEKKALEFPPPTKRKRTKKAEGVHRTTTKLVKRKMVFKSRNIKRVGHGQGIYTLCVIHHKGLFLP